MVFVILQLFLFGVAALLGLVRLLMMLLVSFDPSRNTDQDVLHVCKCLGVQTRKRFECERWETRLATDRDLESGLNKIKGVKPSSECSGYVHPHRGERERR